MKKILSVFLIIVSCCFQFAFALNNDIYIFQDSKTGKKVEFKIQENKYKNINVIKQNVDREVNPSEVQYNSTYSVKDTVRQEAPSTEEGILKKTGKVLGTIILFPITIPVTLLMAPLFAPLYFSSPSSSYNQNGKTMSDYRPPKIDYNELKPAN